MNDFIILDLVSRFVQEADPTRTYDEGYLSLWLKEQEAGFIDVTVFKNYISKQGIEVRDDDE